MSARFKKSTGIIGMLLLCLHMFAGRSDSSRYYFKMSANAGYGIETFKYSGSHGYQTSYKYYNYGYGAKLNNTPVIVPTYNAELKIDCELPLGIKIVNGLSYQSLTFQTPEYLGYGPSYTYTLKEKITMETTHLFFGLGYGRRIKRIILDADICVDRYKIIGLYIDRKIDFHGSTTGYGIPSNAASYQKQDLGYKEGLAIKGSVNFSYKVSGPLYIRAGLVYRYDPFGIEVNGYSGFESTHSNFNIVRTYMLNLGISLSVK
jgi:hypothetical protein